MLLLLLLSRSQAGFPPPFPKNVKSKGKKRLVGDFLALCWAGLVSPFAALSQESLQSHGFIRWILELCWLRKEMPLLCLRPVEIESKGHSSVDNGCTSSGTSVPPSRALWTSALPFISSWLQEKQLDAWPSRDIHHPGCTELQG